MRAPFKKQAMLANLERGVTMVHLDARRPGVVVPAQFAQDAHLRLNFSYRYSIPDLEIGDERVSATLSFGGRPFRCVVPWSAVFGITSHVTGDVQVWPEDVPPELAELADEPRRPALAAVEEDEDAPAPEDAPKPAASKRPHLRLVR